MSDFIVVLSKVPFSSVRYYGPFVSEHEARKFGEIREKDFEEKFDLIPLLRVLPKTSPGDYLKNTFASCPTLNLAEQDSHTKTEEPTMPQNFSQLHGCVELKEPQLTWWNQIWRR